jgi:hypothetical protein
VNGKLFQCRRNLWDFLNAARTSYAATPEVFWIDAICLYQLCEKRRRRHLIIRKDAASDPTLHTLRVVSNDGTGKISGVNRIESSIDLTDYKAKERVSEAWNRKGHRKERPSRNQDPQIVDISMHLDSWIQMALCTAGSDGAMCDEARKGQRGGSAFSKAIKQMNVA